MKSFLLFFALFPLPILCQTVGTGRVSDAAGRPLANVQVMVRDADKARIYAFTASDKEGCYTLNLPEERAGKVLVFRLLGYDEEAVSLAAAAFPLHVTLLPTDHLLNEITVKPQSIRVRNDTTEYSAASFSDGSERSVEDLLRKLPGIDVSENGAISFKGKAIEKILLDDADMFGKSYAIASKNLPASMIGAVQAIEHYHDNRLLRHAESSDQVVLNLRLRDGQKLQRPVGQALLDGGYRDRYSLHVSLFSINKKLKLFDTVNLNNADLTTSFSSENQQNTLFEAFESYADARVADDPSKRAEEGPVKRVETRQSFNSLHLIYQPVNQLQFTGNVLFDRTREAFSEHSHTLYLPDSLRIDETSQVRARPQTLYGWARLKYDGAENLSLDYSAKYNLYSRSADNRLLIPEERFYAISDKNRFLSNHLEGTFSLPDSAALLFRASALSHRNSQHFNYAGGAATETDQSTQGATVQYHTSIKYYNKNHPKFFYTVQAGFTRNRQDLSADARYRGVENASGASLDDVSLLVDADLRYSMGRSALRFRSGIGYRRQGLRRADTLAVDDRRPEFSPHLSYEWAWNAHRFSLFGGFTQGRFSLADHLDYFTGYRSRNTAVRTYTYGSTLNYGLTYLYTGPSLQPFFFVSYLHTNARNQYAAQTYIGSAMSDYTQMEGNDRNSHLLMVDFRTYADPLRHGVDIRSNLYLARYANAVNSDVLRSNRMASSDTRLSLKSVYDTAGNYILGVRFRYNAYRTDGGAANHSLNYSLFQDLIYRPNRCLNLKVSVDEYFFGKSPRLYLFVRPDFSYSFPKHGLSVGFSAYNMLNHDRLSDYQLTDYYLLEEDYSLVPAQYLFNVRVRF